MRQVGSVVYFLTIFSSIFKKLPITIHLLVKEEKLFEGFSIFLLWQPSNSSEQNGLSKVGRGSPKDNPVKLFQNPSTG